MALTFLDKFIDKKITDYNVFRKYGSLPVVVRARTQGSLLQWFRHDCIIPNYLNLLLPQKKL
jgi:hypothetical protein